MGKNGEKDLLLLLKSITHSKPNGLKPRTPTGELHRQTDTEQTPYVVQHTTRNIYCTNVDRCFVWVCMAVPPSAGLYPQDCHEIYQLGIKENGIYTIQPDPKRPALEVQTLKSAENPNTFISHIPLIPFIYFEI